MAVEMRVELHSCSCSCRGGSWVLLDRTQKSPCSGGGQGETLVLGIAEWRQLGKPGSLDAFRLAQDRAEGGDRRQFQRYEVALPIRLERIPNWRDPSAQAEETVADVVATGGALVRSRMALEKGDLIRFRLGTYQTRAEVMYAAAGNDGNDDAAQRLGLKFLDAPLPDDLIPAQARRIP
jgi:hypothetical protein